MEPLGFFMRNIGVALMMLGVGLTLVGGLLGGAVAICGVLFVAAAAALLYKADLDRNEDD
jgi:hypothetical protein